MIRILLISFSFFSSAFAAEYACKGEVSSFVSENRSVEEWILGSKKNFVFSEDLKLELSVGESRSLVLKEEVCEARHLEFAVLASGFRQTDFFEVQNEFLIESESECLMHSDFKRRLIYYSPRLKQVTRFIVSNKSGVLRDCRLKRMR